MNPLLLVILLAHGGYWFGGVRTTPSPVKWAAPEAHMPAATLSWQVMYQTVQVAAGQEEIGASDKTATLTLKLPESRAWPFPFSHGNIS